MPKAYAFCSHVSLPWKAKFKDRKDLAADLCFIHVESAIVDRMRAMPGPGESYMRVILRLVDAPIPIYDFAAPLVFHHRERADSSASGDEASGFCFVLSLFEMPLSADARGDEKLTPATRRDIII